jgi:ribosome maturation factor RimP
MAEPYVRDAGFDLVEVQSGREPAGWVVRLFIDVPVEVSGSPEGASLLEARPEPGAAGAGATVSSGEPVAVEPALRSLIGESRAAGPSLEDCERVSRDLSAALDVADLIPHAYQLEVSSPGLDRPLRRERDFARFAGQNVRVRLVDGVEGRRNFSGTLRGAKDGLVEVECDGRSYQLPVEQVAKANLVPDWEREFHRGGGGPAAPARTHRGGDWGPSAGPQSKRSVS